MFVGVQFLSCPESGKGAEVGIAQDRAEFHGWRTGLCRQTVISKTATTDAVKHKISGNATQCGGESLKAEQVRR